MSIGGGGGGGAGDLADSGRFASDADVVAAIRLALSATSEQRTLRRLLEVLLEKAPPSKDYPSAEAVRLMMTCAKDANASWALRVKGSSNGD